MALFQSSRYVTYPLRTLSPLIGPLIAQKTYPCDLHVLATPPAFVLSQDQTLQFDSSNPRSFLAKARSGDGRLIKSPTSCFREKTVGDGSTHFIGTHIESVDMPPRLPVARPHALLRKAKLWGARQERGRKFNTFVAVFGLTVNL